MSKPHSYCGKNDLQLSHTGVEGTHYKCRVCSAKYIVKHPAMNKGKLEAKLARAS